MTIPGIRFLTVEEVILLHEDQINRYGGRHGLRDEGLLASAVAQPESEFDGNFLHQSIASMAGAYLFHLVQNHPFVDGNKRIGAACATAFLELNGYELGAFVSELDSETGQTLFEKTVLTVARGEMNKDEITIWIELMMGASG